MTENRSTAIDMEGALVPFAEDFATCMAGGGITVDAASIPDADTFTAVIAYANQYLQGLGPEIAAALDEASAAEPINTILADPGVNAIDPAYLQLLQAFDAAQGMPLSTCLEWCSYCVGQAVESAAAAAAAGAVGPAGSAQEGES